MPGTNPQHSSTHRHHLLRAATLMLAATFALPSCMTVALWGNEHTATERMRSDELAVFAIGAENSSQPGAGCEALAVRLPPHARSWLQHHGADVGDHEWLVLRRRHSPGERTVKVTWPRRQDVAVWLVQPEDGGPPHWRVGELDVLDHLRLHRGFGSDCVGEFRSDPPPNLGPQLPRPRMTHAALVGRAPLVACVVLTPITVTSDVVLVAGGTTALLGAGAIVVAASPVLVVMELFGWLDE